MRNRDRKYALLIATAYALLGGLWILFSDRFLAWFYTTPGELTLVQTYKGWFYVGVTAVAGYFMVLWAFRHRSAAERAMRDSASRLKVILETTHDGVWETGSTGDSYYSDSVFRMLGYERVPNHEAREFLATLLHPDDRERFDAGMRALTEGTTNGFETEVRFRHKNDSWRHILLRATCAERDTQGRARIVGAHTDVTALKQTDEALRRANLIVQNSPAVLFRWRADDVWPVEYVSDNVAQWGYTPEEFLSGELSYGAIVHPEDYPQLLSEAREYEKRQLTHFQMEYRIRAKTGETRWVDEHSVIERDSEGEVTCYQGFVFDITGRKEAELALRESRLRYKSLFEAANDAIFLMDGLNVVACNARASALYGVPEEGIVGSPAHAFSTDTQPDGTPSDLVAQRYVDAALEGKPQFFSWSHIRPDGEIFHTEVSLNRVKLGDRYFLQAIERDISERLRAEEEKSRLESQLRHAQKMEAIGQLAGGIAHDFNNLLQVIHGYSEMARDDLSPDSTTREYLDEVSRAAERATSLVSQLLAFSRRTPMQRESVDPAAIVQELTKMLERLLGEDITLRVMCSEPLPHVEADLSQLQQIVVNLCVNARDAMPEGGEIVIELDTRDLTDAFCARNPWARPGHYVRLSVTDTGTGMPEEIRDHIFEPFFTTKDIGKGTGLGLATVYASVQRHNGLITFSTQEGKGTRFEVYLPAQTPASAESAAPATHLQAAAATGTILLAEDDELVRRLSVRVLTQAGYRVYAARDGEEALALFHEHKHDIDLLFFDVIMPKKHGPAVYEAILNSGRKLPVVFTSGYSQTALHLDTEPSGHVYMLEKPYPSSELIAKVSAALLNARTRTPSS